MTEDKKARISSAPGKDTGTASGNFADESDTRDHPELQEEVGVNSNDKGAGDAEGFRKMDRSPGGEQ